MCGIAGFISDAADDVARPQLGRMLARIAHRGPDDEGAWLEGPIAIGNRRLAVVDLSPLGHQPMVSRTRRYVLALNGEIYNHAPLRRELEADGHHFDGKSDTEALLALIERHGIHDALQRCVGMFALALWDRETRVLALARDRFGEKPLYYGWHGGAFLWGSELKTLLAHPRFEGQVDPRSVAMLLEFGFIPGAHCIFTETRKLPPGHILQLTVPENFRGRLTADMCTPRLAPYWSAREVLERGLERPFAGSYEEATDHTESLVAEAVRQQMQADVPLGAFLSGGVDSSLVVALMQKQSSSDVRTFSIGFGEGALNEAPAAKAVAAHLGTRHTEHYVTDDEAVAVVHELPEMFCEPMADASQIPTYLLSKLARTQVTVSLSGDGGDELFAGYPKFHRGMRVHHSRLRRVLRRAADVVPFDDAIELARSLSPAVRARMDAPRPSRVRALLSARTDASVAAALAAINLSSHALMRAPVRHPARLEDWVTPEVAHASYLRTAMLLDTVTYLPDDILVKVDRASMATSLESRAPLLDHRLYAFCAQLPDAFLVAGHQGKRILRDVLYRHVPRHLVDRPKAGFSPPIGRWLRGALHSWAQELLGSPVNQLEGLLDLDAARSLFRAHVAGQRDLSLQIWPVLSLLSWGRHHLR